MASHAFGNSASGFGWESSPGGASNSRGEQPSPSFLQFVLDTPQGGPSSATQQNLHSEVSTAHGTQAQDVEMAGVDLLDQQTRGAQPSSLDLASSGEQATHAKAHGRSKYSNLDWDAHKATIRSLYIEKGMSLVDTMTEMERDYSFSASQKAYKDQFDLWNWKKKLPMEIAHFMTEKSRKRKHKRGKKTVYTYGGKVWTTARAERTIARGRTGYNPPEDADGTTPDGVTYKTPSTISSPIQKGGTQCIISEDSGSDTESVVSRPGSDTDSVHASVPLSFDGMSRTDLLAMWEVVRIRSNEISSEDKEGMLIKVLDGFRHLQGATNEETNKVAYTLAGFYVDTRRSDEADKVLERQTQAHIEILGHEHRKTLQHVLHVVELLNTWNRPDDALGMLSKVREMSAAASNSSTADTPKGASSRKGKGRGKAPRRGNPPGISDSLSQIVNLVLGDPSRAQIDYALSTTRPAVKASDAGAEGVLLAVIRQCTPRPLELAPQLLRATADLLSLYQKLGVQDAHYAEFQRARTAASTALDNHMLWEVHAFYGFEVVEAALEVAARLVKCSFTKEGRELFQKIQFVGIAVFGAADERFIWTLISIGLVYQTHGTWEDAVDWFEAAYAAALSAPWDRHDGIVQALQRALGQRYFSYVTDEGRPFKTVFGVSGIFIRPLRLHMD